MPAVINPGSAKQGQVLPEVPCFSTGQAKVGLLKLIYLILFSLNVLDLKQPIYEPGCEPGRISICVDVSQDIHKALSENVVSSYMTCQRAGHT